MSEFRTLYEWATLYKKAGWNVIPLFDYSKAPSRVDIWDDDFGWIPGWKDLENRMSTDKEFEHWFSEKQPTGIAVITGEISNLVVVDEDSYKENGMKFEHQSPMTVKTARGGTHHFFQYSKEIGSMGYKAGVNIEVKSDGGIVVLPPSIVWVDKEKTQTSEYKWEKKCNPSKLPVIGGKHVEKFQKLTSDNGKVVEDLHEFMNASLGNQHNNLRSIALSTLNRFPQKEWDIASEFIRNAAAKFDPPHPEWRVDKMIKDTMMFVKTHPKEITEKEIEKERQAESKKHLKPKTLTEIAEERKKERELEKTAPSTGYADLDVLIRGFIPGRLYTLTGDTNIGKTTIACNFTERIREQDKKVLYFALEPENSVVDYLASVRTNKPFTDLTDEDIMFDDGKISVFGKEQISEVDDLVEVIRNSPIRYDLIIVDHIGYFVKDKSNTNQDQSNVIKKLAGLAKEKKSAVMIIAHLRKKQANQKRSYIPTADDISGSAAFKQDSTDVLIVTRKHLSEHPEDRRLSNEGNVWVEKTKNGPNGVVSIYFSDRKAKIMTEQEVWSSLELTEKEKLDMLGFPDKNKDEAELSEAENEISLDDIPF